MLDPVSGAITNAPLDDEPETEEERRDVAEAREWRKYHDPIPFEDVLADFGLSLADSESSKGPNEERLIKKVVFTNPARADVRRLDIPNAMRVFAAMQRFAETGSVDVKKLEGGTGELRLRVGNWRVRFVEGEMTYPLTYLSGEEIKLGDHVLPDGNPGEIEIAFDGENHPEDWAEMKGVRGVMIREPKYFGYLFLKEKFILDDSEELRFVARAAEPSDPSASGTTVN